MLRVKWKQKKGDMSTMIHSSTDERQERSKKLKEKHWLAWLCHPSLFRLLLAVAIVRFQFGKAVMRLRKLLRN